MVSSSETCAVYSLKADDSTKEQYPYDFELQMIYELTDHGVKVSHKVINHGDIVMPYCIGGHPAFNCPVYEGENFEDYIKERYLISEQLLDVLAQKVEQSEKLKNATFYLDGFTGFTPIQRKVLEKLLKIGKNVYVGLTLDGRYVRSQYREYELFAMSKKEKYELIKLAQDAGTPVMPDIICWPDERDSKELRHLEQNIERYPYEIYKDEPEILKSVVL